MYQNIIRFFSSKVFFFKNYTFGVFLTTLLHDIKYNPLSSSIHSLYHKR